MAKRVIIEEIEKAQKGPIDLIRNVCIIAHVDHGKSTLANTLVSKAGFIKEGSNDRWLDTREDEKNRTITIKSTSVSFAIKANKLKPKIDPKTTNWSINNNKSEANNNNDPSESKENEQAKEAEPVPLPVTEPEPVADETVDYLINLIDCPGHVDFSSEVSSSLRVCDGSIVVVDSISGVCIQTSTVVRQSLAEKVRPVLFINKFDRLLDLDMDGETIYLKLSKIIENINVLLSALTHNNPEPFNDVLVFAENGTVGFGTGKGGWGFTLFDFAKIYSKVFDMSYRKFAKRLWGDHFYSPKENKWYSEPKDSKGNTIERGFVHFVCNPIKKINSIIDDPVALNKFLVNINYPNPKVLMNNVMDNNKSKSEKVNLILSSWLPCANALIYLITNHLPSPAESARYRVENLYSGPMDDDTALAIKKCDPKGPLVLYVSKMLPASDNKRFYAFGRIFSGSLTSGGPCRLLGPDYNPLNVNNNKSDNQVVNVGSLCLMLGPHVETTNGPVGAGNMIGITGIDNYILKQATLVDPALNKPFPFISLKFSVSPICRIGVSVGNASYLNKLMTGLTRMSKADPLVQVITSETGEHIIAGAGELHLEICVKDLQEMYLGSDCPLIISKPIVSYCESTNTKSSQIACAKSNNKHNRLFLSSCPIDDEVSNAVESGQIPVFDINKAEDRKSIARSLAEYGWNFEPKKLWSFAAAPHTGGLNALVDVTRGVQYLTDVQDLIVNSFIETCVKRGGVLCQEPLRSIRFELEDAKLHADKVHRAIGSIAPTISKAMYASMLFSQPTLCEPIYKCTITTSSNEAKAAVFSTLRARRAAIVEVNEGNGLIEPCTIISHLPVSESFGFSKVLSEKTSGHAFAQLIFSHWQLIPGDFNDPSTTLNNIIMDIRKRKGLSSVLPVVSDYHDNLTN